MAEIRALFFDQDGVIVDTERNGHRVAFNRSFQEFGIDAFWDEERYHRLLQVGGGKERMRRYFEEEGNFRELSADELDQKIRALHGRKTEILTEMLRAGELPLRPGVRRTMEAANRRGIPIGICTTSNEKTAETIAATLLAGIELAFILAGDVVSRKKPDPEIYLKAIAKTGISPSEGVVFEDSHIGTLAAKSAGLNVIATVNGYTRDEDMRNADLVLSTLGDRENPTEVIAPEVAGYLGEAPSLEALLDYFQG